MPASLGHDWAKVDGNRTDAHKKRPALLSTTMGDYAIFHAMTLIRIVGLVFIAAGILLGAAEIVQGLKSPAWAGLSLGKLWFNISPGSLNLVQAIIERYIAEFLWQGILFPLLMLPAWLVFSFIGIILVVMGRSMPEKKIG